MSADRLRSIAATAPTLGPDGVWLAECLSHYIETAPTGVTLDAALGVAVQPGGQPWWRTEPRQERDRLIRATRDRFFAGRSTSAAAAEIIQSARRYESSAWKRYRKFAEPPAADVGKLDELLWRALKTGCGFPNGPRQIIDILNAGK